MKWIYSVSKILWKNIMWKLILWKRLICKEFLSFYIYPRGSKKHSKKGFVKIDNGSMGGHHWRCFVVKDNKSFYFDSFGCQTDNFLLNHLPKPIRYHKYKIQDINSRLCGSYCLYFFYPLERSNYYNTISYKYFD